MIALPPTFSNDLTLLPFAFCAPLNHPPDHVRKCLDMLKAHGLTPEVWIQELLSKSKYEPLGAAAYKVLYHDRLLADNS